VYILLRGSKIDLEHGIATVYEDRIAPAVIYPSCTAQADNKAVKSGQVHSGVKNEDVLYPSQVIRVAMSKWRSQR
jgi:hypothetical protein